MARMQQDLSACTHRGQCLAAKSQGLNAVQLVRFMNLAGGMVLKGQWQVVRHNAMAIVGHADQDRSALLGIYHDLRGACIQGILHQFLQGTGRTLNDFACGDTVAQRGWQQLDAAWAAHGISPGVASGALRR